MSNRSDALVGTAGMNDRNRGLSAETIAGASSRLEDRQHGPRVARGRSDDAVEVAVGEPGRAAEVEGDRVEGQPAPAVVEDQLGEVLVEPEHGVHGPSMCWSPRHDRIPALRAGPAARRAGARPAPG